MPTIPSELIGAYVMSFGKPPSKESYSTIGGQRDVTTNPFNDATTERVVDTIVSTWIFSAIVTSMFKVLR